MIQIFVYEFLYIKVQTFQVCVDPADDAVIEGFYLGHGKFRCFHLGTFSFWEYFWLWKWNMEGIDRQRLAAKIFVPAVVCL